MARNFLNFVTTLQCVICGSGTYHDSTGEWLCDPCHVKSKGAGGVDEGNVIPMCRKHHSEQHAKGWKYMTTVYSFDPEELAKKVEDKWRIKHGKDMKETPRQLSGEKE